MDVSRLRDLSLEKKRRRKVGIKEGGKKGFH